MVGLELQGNSAIKIMTFINAKLEKSNETRDFSKFVSTFAPLDTLLQMKFQRVVGFILGGFQRESTARKLVVKQKRLEPLITHPKLNGKGEKIYNMQTPSIFWGFKMC